MAFLGPSHVRRSAATSGISRKLEDWRSPRSTRRAALFSDLFFPRDLKSVALLQRAKPSRRIAKLLSGKFSRTATYQVRRPDRLAECVRLSFSLSLSLSRARARGVSLSGREKISARGTGTQMHVVCTRIARDGSRLSRERARIISFH